MGRSHLYNAVETDIAPAMPDLLAAGISSYMVDATLMNAEDGPRGRSRHPRFARGPKRRQRHRQDAQHHKRHHRGVS
ncbi:MAG: hypothetical protein ACLUW6_04400 [Coriobacteriaceae bacterium]